MYKTGEVWWSDELYRIFGRKPADIDPTYANLLKLVHPDDRELVQSTVERLRRRGEPFSLDHRLLLPGGQTRVISTCENAL